MSRTIELVLVDFDDTLVATAPRFEAARDELFRILAAEGFAEETARALHHDIIDPPMRARFGFGPRRLPHSFRETYEQLCAGAGRTPDPALAARLEALAEGVLGTPPAIDGALRALERLAARLPTAVYTQSGDTEYQLECVRGAGVSGIVPHERIHVCAHKTADAFREALRLFGVTDPARAWMIGNSIRSDINPALEAGAHAILVEVENPWVYDVVDPIHPDFPRVASFADAVDLLLREADRHG